MGKILYGNIKLDCLTRDSALQELVGRLQTRQRTLLFFVNAHCFNIAQRNSIYRRVLEEADFVLNDGVGMDIGAKLFGFKFYENLNGTDFIPLLLHEAGTNGYKVYRKRQTCTTYLRVRSLEIIAS